MLKNLNILIISPEAWGNSFVSKHHYAVALSQRGNRVYFLNPPSSEFRLEEIRPNLFVLDYKPLFRGLGYFPRWLSALLTRIEIRYLEKKCSVSFTILWNFDSSRFFQLNALPNELLKIAHLVDLTENFQRDKLASTSDICFCTTDFISTELSKYNHKVYKIPHAYTPPLAPIAIEDFRSKDYNVHAGYVGNLSIKYLDWQLIYQLVTKHTEVAFYFIGPLGKSNLSRSVQLDNFIQKVQDQPNTFFLGEKPSSSIPAYLDHFDILLLTYKAEEYKEQLASPHKMLEYLASGKVIVATYTDEYKDKRELVEMVDFNAELPKQFRKVVAYLEYYNSLELIALRQQYSMENTYEKQIKRIENAVTQLPN